MTDNTTTAAEEFAAARVRHAAADGARQSAQGAIDQATAARAQLINDAASTGKDIAAAMRDHRQQTGDLQDSLELATAIEAEARTQMNRAEIVLLREQAAEHLATWDAAIVDAVVAGIDADAKRAEADAAMAALHTAQQHVLATGRTAVYHDSQMAERIQHNAVLASLEQNQLPRVGNRTSFAGLYTEPQLKLMLCHSVMGENHQFPRTLGEYLTSLYSDKVSHETLPKLMQLLADAPSATKAS